MAWSTATNVLRSKMPLPFSLPLALGQGRINKLQQSRQMFGAETGYQNSLNNIQGYRESSDIQRARMNQSLAARGLGNSSIATQNKQTFENQYSRRMYALQGQAEMNRRQLTIMRRQRVFNRRMGPLMFLDGLYSKVGDALGMASGMGGGGGDGIGEAPSSDTQGVMGYDRPQYGSTPSAPNYGDSYSQSMLG